MADPWDQFQDAHDEDPWGQFQDAPASPSRKPRKTSQTLGFMEGVTNVLKKAPANPLDLIPGLDSRPGAKRALEGTQNYFAKRELTERPGVVGKVVGTALATAPVAAITKNPFAVGAMQGALGSERDDVGGIALDAATGAVLNKAGDKVAGAVGDALRPVIAPAVKRLRAAGVSLTPGMVRGGAAMVREDKLMSRPIVGEAIAADRGKTLASFNTATVNRALKPLGVRVPDSLEPGNESVAFAKKALRDAYDDVIPKMSVKLDGRAFIAKLAPSAASLEAPQRKQLQSLLSQHLKSGDLAGQSLKDAHGELRRLASSYARDQSASNRELGKVLYEAADDLMDAMSAQNPTLAPRLAQVNEAYRGYKVAAGAAKSADDGIFSTGDLKRSVLRGDRSKDKDAAARGAAFMQDFSRDARKVIPARTPDSGTAGRQQAGNLFAYGRGVGDLAAYRGRQALEAVRAIPRPAWTEAPSRLLLKHRNLFGFGAGLTPRAEPDE